MMEGFHITPEDNRNRLDVIEARVNLILVFIGGQFLGVFALVITIISILL